MMVMTAKVDFKKVIGIITAAAVLILAAILLLDGGEDAAATAAPVSANDGRVAFLRDFGWEVTPSPVESGQVKIPQETSEVFDRYNMLQKSQGYDLSAYAGKKVMRYVYSITNYPGASGNVYATVLVHKDQVIGGDVTDTSPGGRIRGFRMPQAGGTDPTLPQADAPTQAATVPAA